MNQLSVQLACIQMRSGVEIWLESEKAKKLQIILKEITSHKFIDFESETFNTADVVGIFLATTMEDYTHRKNGQWKCNEGNWHDKGMKCECPNIDNLKFLERKFDAIKACGKCDSGFITGTNVFGQRYTAYCECQKEFIKI